MKITFHLDSPLLFKYCDERGVDIFQSLRLKVTPPIEFNDPFEFMPKVQMQVSRAKLAKSMSSAKLMRELWRKIPTGLDFESFRSLYVTEFHRRGSRHLSRALGELQEAATRAKKGVLVFMSERFVMACYSEIPDDILMWAHYAKSHQGLVVGFDAKHGFFRNGNNTMPVIYRSERVDAFYDHRGLNFREPEMTLFRTKSIHWSYEREWRQYFPLRQSAKVQTELGTVAYFQKLPPRVIAEVILGFRSGPRIERELRDALSRPSLRHVRLRRAVLHERDFRLTLVDA